MEKNYDAKLMNTILLALTAFASVYQLLSYLAKHIIEVVPGIFA